MAMVSCFRTPQVVIGYLFDGVLGASKSASYTALDLQIMALPEIDSGSVVPTYMVPAVERYDTLLSA